MELDTLHVVGRLGQHQFLEELAAHIESMSEAVKKAGHGAKGKVVLTLTVGMPKEGPENLVSILEDFDLKFPKTHKTKGQWFYVGAEGGLFDRDPSAPELPMEIRAVETQEPVVRDAGESEAVRRAE